MKKYLLFLIASFVLVSSIAQKLQYGKQDFDLHNVKGEVVQFQGENVLKLERDITKWPFDINNVESTVDGPTFAKLMGLDMKNGTIEVKVLSHIMENSPFPAARGFIGVGFRVDGQNNFDCIYLRPSNGRADDQVRRNHTVQYISYPGYNFGKLRREANGVYETYADIALDEWIDVKIELQDKKARLYIKNQKEPSFIVNEMFRNTSTGGVSLWVEVGTVGYFKDLKVTPAK
jgi:hypothetical protein